MDAMDIAKLGSVLFWARGRLGRIFWIASGANFGSLRGVAPGANC